MSTGDITSKIKSKKYLLLTGFFVLILSIIFSLKYTKSKPSPSATTSKTPNKVEIGPVIDATYGIGTVKAQKTFALKLGVISTIQSLHVKEGEYVKKGALLIKMNEGTEFHAPFNGVITSLPFQEGESVFPQLPILTLVNPKKPYLAVSMDQEAILKVRQGQKAKIRFDTLKNQRINGVVRSVFSNEGQFWVHVDTEELPQGVLPGMTADVAIELERREKVILVPAAAVNERQIRIKRNGKTLTIPVIPGSVMGDQIEIKSGDLREGEEVLLPSG